jgi:hypothetical protein
MPRRESRALRTRPRRVQAALQGSFVLALPRPKHALAAGMVIAPCI